MKKTVSILLALCLLASLAACGESAQTQAEGPTVHTIVLSDSGILCDDLEVGNSGGVFVSHDIIYYEDRDTYDSGHAYGEGTDSEKHSADEAAAHTVVNITQPGTYIVSGKLSKGQIRIDLGEEAFTDPAAKVNLVLADAHITCEVAPAILFLNVYECDTQWEENTPTSDIDTTEAGANLVLEGENTVNGSYVARIYKDGGEEKKLWKQDGAIYSYMSLNVSGSGKLDLNAENEGLDTELHLTINGGEINIRSGNDGINTNEDGVSVTTINGGNVHIVAGLGVEGDGIDSNGWLVINGGTVISSANPAADAGLDSDMGSYVNGGTVLAFGSTMDWAESDSDQVTMNLQFAGQRQAGSTLRVTTPEGAEVFSFDPAQDAVMADNARSFQGAVLSCPAFALEQTYQVYVNDVMQVYTGTDVRMRPGMGGFGGGMGGGRGEGFGGQRPDDGQTPPQLPEGMENMTPPEGFQPGQLPEGMEGMAPPEGFTPGEWPEGMENMAPPEGFQPGQLTQEGQMQGTPGTPADAQSLFYMQDKVNNFSGLTNSAE